jgi:DNA-binding protein HU-beta
MKKLEKINEKKLIRQIADESGVTIISIEKVIKSFKDIVIDNIRNNKKVMLTGFGHFEPFMRYERKGINPNTYKKITIKETRIGKFRSGYKMRRLLKKD